MLLLPGSVQGDEGQVPSFPGFALHASNGYGLAVFAVAPPEAEDNEGGVYLFLVRGKRTLVTYSTPATVSTTTIDVDLGKLGRISVSRVATGRTKRVRRGCEPGRTKRVKAERYEGTIEFHGEEGFTDVSATSAPLEYTIFCGSPEGSGPPREKILPGARLDVEKRRPEKYRLEFDATQRRPGARTLVSVEVAEQRGEMNIYRATSTWASADALRYDQLLHGATVRPPAPFDGYGSFDAGAFGAKRWTGNLTVDLPGHSNVPITGPGFSASLDHPRR